MKQIMDNYKKMKDIGAGSQTDITLVAQSLIGAGMDFESAGGATASAATAAAMVGAGHLSDLGAKAVDLADGCVVTNSFSALTMASADTEHFTNDNPAALIAINYEVNVQDQNQHPSVEAFFPTVEIDPTAAGVASSVETTYIETKPLRVANGSKPTSISLIKAMYDLEGPLVRNDLRLVPVKSDVTEINLDFLENAVIPETGETVQTGPFKLGVPFDIIRESQSPAMISSGILDVDTTLATLPRLDSVYTKVTADGVEEKIKFDLSSLVGSLWKSSLTGEDQGIELSLVQNKVFNLATMKLYDGSSSVGLATLDPALKVELKFIVKGEGNLKTDLEIRTESVELVRVLNSANQEVTSGTSYDDIVDAVATMSLEAVSTIAYIPNRGLEKDGSYLTRKKFATIMDIAPMQPHSVTSPIKGNDINGSDVGNVTDLIRWAYAASTAVGLLTISQHIDKMATDTAGNVTLEEAGYSFPLMELVTPRFETKIFETIAMIDSPQSVGKRESFKASFEDFISVEFAAMTTTTGYSRVASEAKIAFKPVLMVPTALVAAIGDKITVGGVEITLETNESQLVGNKAILAITTEDKSKETSAYRYGTFVHAPALVGERSMNKRKLTIIPFGKHHVTLPIVTVISMPDIQDYVGKNVSICKMT